MPKRSKKHAKLKIHSQSKEAEIAENSTTEAAKPHDPDYGWTEEIELYLKRLQSKALVYKMLHSRSAVKLARKSKIMSIVNIVATATAGTTLFANLPYSNTVVNVITALILYITSILVAISEFVMDSSEVDEHKTAENDFEDLVQTIGRQLVFEPRFRQHAREFVIWIDRDFRSKFEKSPLISPSMIKKMEKEFGSKLNPELIDAKHINEPERDPTVDLSVSEEDADEDNASDAEDPQGSFKHVSFEGESDVDDLQADLDQMEKGDRHAPTTLQRVSKSTKKRMKSSVDIFEREQANNKIVQIWDDMQMNWELSRYQQ